MRKPEFIGRQGRRPSGPLGYIVAMIMAGETATENMLTLDILGLEPGEAILEIGCGHGATLREAARRDNTVTLTGVDFSDVMLRVARHRNRKLIGWGRIQLDHGDSADLPYLDASFDKAYTMHTIYFWQKPELHLREVLRVLRPGGSFVLGCRSGKDAAMTANYPTSVYHFRSNDEIEALFKFSGFEAVNCQTRDAAGRSISWVNAQKPTL